MHETLTSNIGSFLIFAAISFSLVSMWLTIINSKYASKSEFDEKLRSLIKNKRMFSEKEYSEINESCEIYGLVQMATYIRRNFVNFSLAAILFLIGATFCMWSMLVDNTVLKILSVIWIFGSTLISLSVLLSILYLFHTSKENFLKHFNHPS